MEPSPELVAGEEEEEPVEGLSEKAKGKRRAISTELVETGEEGGEGGGEEEGRGVSSEEIVGALEEVYKKTNGLEVVVGRLGEDEDEDEGVGEGDVEGEMAVEEEEEESPSIKEEDLTGRVGTGPLRRKRPRDEDEASSSSPEEEDERWTSQPLEKQKLLQLSNSNLTQTFALATS